MNANPPESGDTNAQITATAAASGGEARDAHEGRPDRQEKPPPPRADQHEAPSTTAAAPKEAASSAGGKGGKGSSDRRSVGSAEEKLKVEVDWEVTELLGSVTTQNCPGTRTSARVIQKMKQDQIRPTTPPVNERDHKKEEKGVQKTPSQVRAIKHTWSNLERNHFFDALNDFGKDFDSIGNYINTKLKRKCATDVSFKTKDQVRQQYYQMFHKICKYLKFSDEVKKPVQELYALINYGEMRRKLQFVTDKHFLKLRHLVYHGHITVRWKGKNIRIKTPSCKALRRLNMLDDSLEGIRLPSKIEVIVCPANIESFGRVQMIAQNPHVRCTVALHKKLLNFIKTFQYKWRSMEMKLAEEEMKLCQAAEQCEPNPDLQEKLATTTFKDPDICFRPKPGVQIHRPLLSITEYLSSVNICLAAYEERMGVKVRGETLNVDRPTNKRQRTESGSDKLKTSPDAKKQKQSNSPPHEKLLDTSFCGDASVIKEETASSQEAEKLSKSESSGDELNEEINELLAEDELLPKDEPLAELIKVETAASETVVQSVATSNTQPSPLPLPYVTPAQTSRASSKRQANSSQSHAAKPQRASLIFRPLITDDVIKSIRRGWTLVNAADITIGDLYVVLGHDSKLELEYHWTKGSGDSIGTVGGASTISTEQSSADVAGPSGHKINGIRMPYNASECNDQKFLETVSTSSLGNKLKHLLLIANLSERSRKRQCSCGHTCERNAVKTRFERNLAAKSFVSNKAFPIQNGGRVTIDGNGVFRHPTVPLRRPTLSMDPVKQMTALTSQKLSRQVVVQRLLLPGGSHQLQSKQHDYAQPVRASVDVVDSSARTTQRSPRPFENKDALLPPPLEATRVPKNFDLSHKINEFRRAAVDEIEETMHGLESDNSTPGSFPDSAFDDCSTTSLFNGMSPMHLLRDSTSNSRWLEENLNDFSLTSLLGHLDEINASRDILDPSSNLSVLSESSVDYRHKFQEITALMQSQDKD